MDNLSMDDLKRNLRDTCSTIGYARFFEGANINDDAFHLSLRSMYKRGSNLCHEILKRLKDKSADQADPRQQVTRHD